MEWITRGIARFPCDSTALVKCAILYTTVNHVTDNGLAETE